MSATGGDFAAEVTWSNLQPILAQHFRGRSGALKIVEVGCGLGELSYLMQEAGHRVVAIDPSPEAIATTRGKGVADARQCGIEELAQMEEERGTFDVVLFTRSLHHIGQDLTGVLRLVRDRLLRREDGLLIIEEFGREDCDQLTAEWYYALHDSLLAAGLISPPRRHRHHHQHKGQDAKQEEELMKKEEKRDALERWERQFKWSHHGMEGIEHLHLGHEMVTAIESVFGSIDVQRQPVLFRFIANHVDRRLNSSPTNHHNNESAQAEEEAGNKAYEISRTVLRWEQKMIDRGRVLPLGILGVATVDQRMDRQDSTNSRPSSVSQC